MLSLLRRQIAFQLPRNTRCLSEATAESSGLASTSAAPIYTPTPIPSAAKSAAKSSAMATKLQYFVARNTNNNLPVYSDVRNQGSRYLVLIRNVEGNAAALAKDLSKSLFEAGSYEASRMKVQINQSKHIVITGGRWKEDVTHWLKNKGF